MRGNPPSSRKGSFPETGLVLALLSARAWLLPLRETT